MHSKWTITLIIPNNPNLNATRPLALASHFKIQTTPCPIPIKNPKPTIGIEPMTSSLPRKCSTTELRGHKKLTNLTKKVERETGLEPATLSLEGWRSSQLSYSRKSNQPQIQDGEGRIRTSEGWADRFTVCSLWPLGNLPFFWVNYCPLKSVPQPSSDADNQSFSNQSVKTGAGKGTRTPDLLITNQLLYQLSYASSANKKPPLYTLASKVSI